MQLERRRVFVGWRTALPPKPCVDQPTVPCPLSFPAARRVHPGGAMLGGCMAQAHDGPSHFEVCAALAGRSTQPIGVRWPSVARGCRAHHVSGYDGGGGAGAWYERGPPGAGAGGHAGGGALCERRNGGHMQRHHGPQQHSVATRTKGSQGVGHRPTREWGRTRHKRHRRRRRSAAARRRAPGRE